MHNYKLKSWSIQGNWLLIVSVGVHAPTTSFTYTHHVFCASVTTFSPHWERKETIISLSFLAKKQVNITAFLQDGSKTERLALQKEKDPSKKEPRWRPVAGGYNKRVAARKEPQGRKKQVSLLPQTNDSPKFLHILTYHIHHLPGRLSKWYGTRWTNYTQKVHVEKDWASI